MEINIEGSKRKRNMLLSLSNIISSPQIQPRTTKQLISFKGNNFPKVLKFQQSKVWSGQVDGRLCEQNLQFLKLKVKRQRIKLIINKRQ